MLNYDELKGEWEEFDKKSLPKSYSESKLFIEIWKERDHFSELTGKKLYPHGTIKWHWQFLHVLPKGAYGKFRFFKYNILLGTPWEHDHQNQFDIFEERRELLTRLYYEVFYNKQF